MKGVIWKTSLLMDKANYLIYDGEGVDMQSRCRLVHGVKPCTFLKHYLLFMT